MEILRNYFVMTEKISSESVSLLNLQIWNSRIQKTMCLLVCFLMVLIKYSLGFSNLVHYDPGPTSISRASLYQPMAPPAVRVPQLKTSYPTIHSKLGQTGREEEGGNWIERSLKHLPSVLRIYCILAIQGLSCLDLGICQNISKAAHMSHTFAACRSHQERKDMCPNGHCSLPPHLIIVATGPGSSISLYVQPSATYP